MLSNVSSSIFLNSSSIELQPVVSAEWNQNLFNPPYLTVAGTGVAETVSTSSTIVAGITGANAYTGFTTNSFALTSNTGTVVYTSNTTVSAGNAYKIVTYMKTSDATPVMLSAFAQGGSSTQFGSSAAEINSLGWTKIVTYIGSSGTSDAITSITFTLQASTLSSDQGSNKTIYYTTPEIYKTTYFDYQHNSLWPTESPFTFFRPGESYVGSGNINATVPTAFRKVTSSVLTSQPTTYSPVSPIIQTPSFTMASAPVPVFKNALANDMAPYKYFVSDASSLSITGIYAQNINSNKLVIKFNTLITVPTINIYLDGTILTVDGSTSITPPANADSFTTGVLVLYWTGSAWTKTKWSTMPAITNAGLVSPYTSFKKITVTQISKTTNSSFTSSNTNFTADAARMQLIEVSPRLEVDLTKFVKTLDITKSLDSKNNFVPISSINANDATLNLTAIPIVTNTNYIPIFASQSNLSTNILSNMLRKNIKFHINFRLKSYFDSVTKTFIQLSSPGNYIPGGVFYSDTWEETDVKDVKIQCFDVTRYLQTTPVPDYVSNLKPVFDVITNILDLAGFTDYDFDSLYKICNSKTMPLDLAYFYCNSRDSTIVDTLAELFLAYQIGAWIDEYGVMNFKSLSDVLSNSTSQMTINDSSVIEGGYSVSNKAKPGKIALKYQTPKIKQSLALQNATNPNVAQSPSFIYTTSNDVVWQQTTLDSVGFNYLASDMSQTANKFQLNSNDLLDIFHTFTLNNNGYAVIENELVSFVYKEYTVGSSTVSVKSDIELSSEINRYIKNNQIGLTVSSLDSNGMPAAATDYNVVISPTGYITNVQRGLFGTVPSAHSRIATNIANKSLSEATISSSYTMTTGTSTTSITNNTTNDAKNPSVSKIAVTSPASTKCLVYPTSVTDPGYKTYSVKFDLTDIAVSASGLFFNLTGSSPSGAYFVELIKYNQIDPKTGSLYVVPVYRYIMAIYKVVSTTPTVIAWAEVTGTVGSIISNFEKVLVKVPGAGAASNYSYRAATDQAFKLKVTHFYSDGTDSNLGEDNGELIQVFLNNVEITGWQTPATLSNSDIAYGWSTTAKNTLTGLRKKVNINSGATINTVGTKFGFYTSTLPVPITSITYPSTISASTNSANLREIYASTKPLKERSVSYWYQDREFLNGIIQGQNLYSKYNNYMMQTTPEVVGINVYDVQYTTPAAVSVDILPIEYSWYYFPGTAPTDQSYYQKQNVDEYSLSYSTPINTGFRAKMAIVNNSSHMVYLSKQSDATNSFNVNLNLWTHEIIAPSDPVLLEKVTDPANASEVAQVDSQWIQSSDSANKMLNVIAQGFDGFSKDTSLTVFGNPLIQVGDVITLTYSLSKINAQTYFVHSVSQSFDQGLKTTLVLNMLGKGTSLAS